MKSSRIKFTCFLVFKKKGLTMAGTKDKCFFYLTRSRSVRNLKNFMVNSLKLINNDLRCSSP